jgi:phospholipid-binding lipoprotein MlaA
MLENLTASGARAISTKNSSRHPWSKRSILPKSWGSEGLSPARLRRDGHAPCVLAFQGKLMSVCNRLSDWVSGLGVAAIVLALAGCATPPPADDPDAVAEYRETNDPLEPTNRVIYAVNDKFDVYLLRPAAEAYRAVLPQTVRDHTHQFLDNFGKPVQLANDMLEGKPRRAGNTLMRFLTNSTLGLGGIFDVATGFGYPDHDADGGITLAEWGVPNGPYLYLPVFGPSSPREAFGMGLDYVVDPFSWVGKDNTDKDLGYVKIGVSALDARSRVLDDLDKMTASALDPYATIRSLYRQHRKSQIDDAAGDDAPTIPAWFPAEMRGAGKSAGGSKP